MGTHRFRLLFAAAAEEPFIERIESDLLVAVQRRGGDLLLLVEGRDPPSPAVSSIDLEDVADLRGFPKVGDADQLTRSLNRIIDHTTWYARVSGEPDDQAVIRAKLSEASVHIRRILCDYQPQAVMVWNGLLGTRATVVHCARELGIPVWFCEKGPLPGSWCVDPQGVNAGSSLSAVPLSSRLAACLASPLPPAARASVVAEIEATAAAGASAWEQSAPRGPAYWRKKLGIPARRPVLFFPLQVDADTNMRFFSPHFTSSSDALQAVADAIRPCCGMALGASSGQVGSTQTGNKPASAGGGDWFLLAKPHPKGTYAAGRIERAVDGLGACTGDINLHDALSLSRLVVTVNSTVAAEAAWRGKPVLQLGQGILSGKGIVAEFQPGRPISAQIDAAVAAWDSDPRRYERALLFYHYLKHDYLLTAGDPHGIDRFVDCVDSAGQKHGPGAAADAVARTYAWKPALEILNRLAARRPRPARIILVGYGRNARRLLKAAAEHPAGRRVLWLVWDDDPPAVKLAARDGLSLTSPFQESPSPATLWIITPRRHDSIVSRLETLGYREEKDYWRLCATRLPFAQAALAES